MKRPPSAASVVVEELRRKEKELLEAAAAIRANLDVIEGVDDEESEAVSAADFLRETASFEWAVGGLVAAGTVTMVTADPAVGKTTFLTQMSASLAAGVDCFGFRVAKQHRILYCLAEGSRHAYRERFRKACQALGFDPAGLDWFIQPADQVEFELRSSAVGRLFRASGAEVIVLDTLGYFHGGDENDSKEWKDRVMKPLRSFSTKFGISFILVHHHTKASEFRQGAQKGRGSGAMFGDVDHWLRLEKVPLSKDEQQLPEEERMRLLDRRRELFIDKNKYGRMDYSIRLDFDKSAGLFSVSEG